MFATTLVILLVFFLLSVPVAAALGLLGLSLGATFSFLPIHRAIGEVAWSTSAEFILVAVPLYILMGEILLRSGVAARMYDAMVKWLSWLPGGLMHSNIGACAMFAATSGSSVATAATIGTIALPEQRKRGYSERLFLGSIAAGGTLGILIPPSINLIIYALLSETSIPHLYLASLVPGMLLALLFSATILVACTFRPAWRGDPIRTSWADRRGSLRHLLPPLGIFAIVVGSIYAGLATPSESAALGVLASLVLAKFNARLSIDVLRQAIEGTLRVTGMTMLIVLGAYFLNFVLSTVGITRAAVDVVQGLGLTPMGTIIVICLMYIALGTFMDALAMMVTTAPLVVPIIVAQGIDPIWFGVLMMILSETGMITPPFGINLFVVQSVRRRGALTDVIVGASLFLIAMFCMIVLLIVFPGIAMWLPDTMR